MIKFVIVILAVFTLMTSTALAADVFGDACKAAPSSSVCLDSNKQGTNTNPANHLIHVAADIVAALAGITAIIMIIVSGIKFISGGSNQQSVVQARNTLLWAVIGLAVIGLAWTIINYAVDKLIYN